MKEAYRPDITIGDTTMNRHTQAETAAILDRDHQSGGGIVREAPTMKDLRLDEE